MDFALNSPVADIAAKMMRLDQVRFFYDQLFIKEPGTQAPTAWHHDLPFWPFDGNHIAFVWISCTPVSTETSGLLYVAGSHKWKKMYRPVPAVPIEDFMSEEVKRFEECPMFHKEFNNPEYKFLSWKMEVGDALVHHPLIVNGFGKTVPVLTGRSRSHFGILEETQSDTGHVLLFQVRKIKVSSSLEKRQSMTKYFLLSQEPIR